MCCVACAQDINIFFENAHKFGQDCEHMPHYCSNCTWRIKFCQFLHKHKGNIVRSLNVFSHLNSCSQTAHLISALRTMITLCSHQPWFVVCSQKINLLHTKDTPRRRIVNFETYCIKIKILPFFYYFR